jgi:ribosomal-protein-serine acetyltransferase
MITFAHPLGDGAELGYLEPWHAEEFHAAVDHNRDHLLAEIPAAHIIHTVEDARQYLQRWADARAADTRHLYGVWLVGKLVGCLQLFDFDTGLGRCELGVWMAPEAQGRGLVTTACRILIDWAVRERGITRVQWTNNPTNTSSSAVARRLGMTREGLLRSAWQVGGVRHDGEVWSVLAGEWPTPVWSPGTQHG